MVKGDPGWLVNSTLSYTASKCELLQYKRGNKLLRQPGEREGSILQEKKKKSKIPLWMIASFPVGKPS